MVKFKCTRAQISCVTTASGRPNPPAEHLLHHRNYIRTNASPQFGDVDPDDLLSFLDPPGASGPDLSTPPSSGSNASVASGPGSAPPHPPHQQGSNEGGGAKSASGQHRSGAGSSGPDEDLLNLIDNYE